MTVSVIIPMYNASRSIVSTLESVRNQTYRDFEIIIINDGSEDLSGQIESDYIADNSHLNIVLLNQENKGVSAARNMGLRTAKGDWIALLDSDDEWLPNKIERQIEIVNKHLEVDFLGTNRNGDVFKNFFFKKIGSLTRMYPKDLLYKMFFITPTVMFKRSILKEVNSFDETQSFCEDGNFFIKICQKKSCFLLNESLVVTGGGKAHFGESGLSSNMWQMQQGELLNIKYAFKSGIVNIVEFGFIYAFSMFKYLRRLWIVKTT